MRFPRRQGRPDFVTCTPSPRSQRALVLARLDAASAPNNCSRVCNSPIYFLADNVELCDQPVATINSMRPARVQLC